MEDTEEDNDEQVCDDDQEFKDKEFQSKVKSDCDYRKSISSSCNVSSSDKISDFAALIVQEKDKIKIAKCREDVCHVEGIAAFKINNNIWKCELELNI